MWLRLYQLEMDGKLPRGSGQPLWWTLRRPFRPLGYHAAHRMFERAGAVAGADATLHSLRHTAAYRMAEDPALPLTDVQLVLGHALLTTTQLYLTPRKEDVIRRVLAHHGEQVRQARQRSRPVPAPGYRRESLDVLFGTGRRDHCHDRCAAGGGVGVAVGLPGRADPVPAPASLRGWPATRQSREQILGQLASDRCRARQRGARRHAAGLALLLDWLACQDGGSWQEGWLASGADAAGVTWTQVAGGWLESGPRPAGPRAGPAARQRWSPRSAPASCRPSAELAGRWRM